MTRTAQPVVTLLALFLLSSFPSAALAAPPVVELEGSVGAGVDQSLAPTVGLRAGLDFWRRVTVSLRGMAVLGPAAGYHGDGGDAPGGYQAWAVFPELRFHTRDGPLRPFVGLGLGVGYLIGSLEQNANEVSPREGLPGPFGQASGGLQYADGPGLMLGVEGGVQLFTRVRGGQGYTFSPPTPAQEGARSSEKAAFLQATVGWRFR